MVNKINKEEMKAKMVEKKAERQAKIDAVKASVKENAPKVLKQIGVTALTFIAGVAVGMLMPKEAERFMVEPCTEEEAVTEHPADE